MSVMWKMPEGNLSAGPAQIMREQGEYLRNLSNGKLHGQVASNASGGDIANHFNVVVPDLNFYSFTLVNYLQSPLSLYPGIFRSAFSQQNIKIENEQAFRHHLADVLGSQQAQDLIRTLMSQVG